MLGMYQDQKPSSAGKIFLWIIVVVGLLNLVFWFAGPTLLVIFKMGILPFSSQWEAVYMANGDIYVGKILGITKNTLTLGNSYFLNVSKSLEDNSSSTNFGLTGMVGNNISLVKWGFQQPMKSQGELYFNRSTVLFWEKLDQDSEVVKKLEANK